MKMKNNNDSRFESRFNKVLDIFLRLFFPKVCPLCGEIIPIDREYCRCSWYNSRRIEYDYCRHCGCDKALCVCGSPNATYLPEIAAVYYYHGKVRSDILDMKFYGKKRLARKLGTDMAERCAQVYCTVDFDMVTFVPMSRESLKNRGYNQSQLLSEIVAESFLIPSVELLCKIKNTQQQHKLSGKERKKNLSGSMKVIDADLVKGKTILLCDDVKTTGATLNECVKLLMAAGAAKVCCLCIAVTKYSNYKINKLPLFDNNINGDTNETVQRQLRRKPPYDKRSSSRRRKF